MNLDTFDSYFKDDFFSQVCPFLPDLRDLDLRVQLRHGLDDHRGGLHLRDPGHRDGAHLHRRRGQCPRLPLRRGRGQGGPRGHGHQQRHRQQRV